MGKVIAVIPARYKSTRFPGKPLSEIHGKSMLARVYDNARAARGIDEVLVATDDERIASHCRENGMGCAMTSRDCRTGTDRIAEVSRQRDASIYINVQGDEPMLPPATIEKALEPFAAGADFEVVNLMARITDLSDLVNSTVPKVVVNRNHQAIFFSRAPIPSPKAKRPIYFKQVCVYAFKKDVLQQYGRWERGAIEESEDIEILRFIENNVKVGMVEVEGDTVAVDTPADLEIVRRLLAGSAT